MAASIPQLNGRSKPSTHSPGGGDSSPGNEPNTPHAQEGQILVSIHIRRIVAENVEIQATEPMIITSPPWLPRSVMTSLQTGIHHVLKNDSPPSDGRPRNDMPR